MSVFDLGGIVSGIMSFFFFVIFVIEMDELL